MATAMGTAVTDPHARGHRRPLRRARRAALLPLATAATSMPVALAADLSVVPTLSVETVYSDNITLAPADEKEGAVVGIARPGLRVNRDDDTLALALNYDLQAVGYLDQGDANEIFQQIDSRLNAALLQDRVFVEVNGNLFQQVADPTNPFIQNNITRTGNRTDTLQLGAGVTWRESLGNAAELIASHRQGRLEFDQEGLIDSATASSQVTLSSRQEVNQGFTWSFTGNLDRIDFLRSDFPATKFSTLLGEVGYWVTPTLRTFVSGGVESDYLAHRSTIVYDTPIWIVGMQFAGARDQISISYGQRVFGDTVNASWVHQLSEKLDLRVTYIELPSTNPQAALNQRGFANLVSLLGLEDLVGLDRPGNADSFVQRRLTGGFNATGNRLRLRANAFYERRDDRVNLLGQPVDGDEYAVGGTFQVSWDAGSNTTITGTVRYEQANFLLGAETERFDGGISMRYALGTRTDLTLDLRRFQGDSNAFDFTENRVGLVARRRFE